MEFRELKINLILRKLESCVIKILYEVTRRRHFLKQINKLELRDFLALLKIRDYFVKKSRLHARRT